MIDCQCDECINERTKTFNWTEHEVRMIAARQKREEFRAKLADLGRSQEIVFSSKVLEAYDLVHCPELRPSEEIKAICAIMIEIEVRSGPDYDKKYVAYPSEYGAGCLIEGLRNQGYEITKINQK